MSTKLQTHKYKCKCKLVTYTQALESVADLKQIALLVITFPCRCRGVGRPRRERVDAHFRHRFLRCPCRCRGLGRPRREKVDAQFYYFWPSLVVTHKQTCQFMVKGRWHETLFFPTANESISSTGAAIRGLRQGMQCFTFPATHGLQLSMRRCACTRRPTS